MVYRKPYWYIEYCRERWNVPGTRFIHGLCKPGGTLCANPLILALPLQYRYGAIAQHIGSVLAGSDCTAADANHFAQDFFDIRILYWTSPHGALPVVDGHDLQRVATYISLPTTYPFPLRSSHP